MMSGLHEMSIVSVLTQEDVMERTKKESFENQPRVYMFCISVIERLKQDDCRLVADL